MSNIIVPVRRVYNGGGYGYHGYTESFSSKTISLGSVQQGDLITVEYSVDGNPTPSVSLNGAQGEGAYSQYFKSWGYRNTFTVGGACYVIAEDGNANIVLSVSGTHYWTYQIVVWRGPNRYSQWAVRTAHQSQSLSVSEGEIALTHAAHRDWHNEFVWNFSPSGPYQYIYNLRRHDVLYKTMEATANGTIRLNCSYHADFYNMIITCTPGYIFYGTFMVV